MAVLIRLIIAVGALVALFWMMLGARSKSSDDAAVIDPTDARQIGTLIGLTGGTIADAAVARHALQRFEQEKGRKATVRDMSIVAGMMRTIGKP